MICNGNLIAAGPPKFDNNKIMHKLRKCVVGCVWRRKCGNKAREVKLDGATAHCHRMSLWRSILFEVRARLCELVFLFPIQQDFIDKMFYVQKIVLSLIVLY